MDNIFGDKKAALRNGFFSILFATILLLIYLYNFSEPISKQNFYKTKIKYDNCYLREGHTSTELIFNVREKKYFLNHSIWKDNYKTNEVLKHFQNRNICNIWLSSQNSNRIAGIETETVYLDPGTGINLMKTNRKALTWLISVFYLIGVVSILKSLLQRT